MKCKLLGRVEVRNGQESDEKMMQCFYLERRSYPPGVSGTGRVAEGVQLPSGRVVIEWLTSTYHSIGIYESLPALLAIHGHGGATNVVFFSEKYERFAEGEDHGSRI